MLLIAGGAVEDEPYAARAIQAGAPDSVTVWVAPGSGHIAGLRTQPEQWQERVREFLDDSLRTPV